MTRGVPLLRFWLMREASLFMCHMCGRITDTHFYSRHHSIIFSYCVFDKFSSWNLNVFHSTINFIWHHHSSSAHRYSCAIAAHPTRVTTFAFCHTSCPDGPNGEEGAKKWRKSIQFFAGRARVQAAPTGSPNDASQMQNSTLWRLTRTSCMVKVTSKRFLQLPTNHFWAAAVLAQALFINFDLTNAGGGEQVSQTRWQLRRA